MIKLKIKNKQDGILTCYSSRKTNTIEHIFGIAKLYQEIKENQPDITDKEIKEIVKRILKKDEEK